MDIATLALALALANAEPDPVASGLSGRPIPTKAVYALAFAPDAQTLAIGTGDGRLILHDLETEQRRTVQAHDNWTFDIAYRPDGAVIATGGGDNMIRLRDARTLEPVRLLDGHEDDVHGIVWTPDGTTIISGGDDRMIRWWDVESGTQVRSVLGHVEQITRLAISPDGTVLATASRDDTVVLWRVADGTAIGTLDGHLNDVLDIDFRPDGRELASASYDTTVIRWNLDAREPIDRLRVFKDRVFAVRYLPGAWPRIIAGGEDRAWRLRLVADGENHDSSRVAGTDVSRIAVTARSEPFAIGSSDGTVEIHLKLRPSSVQRFNVGERVEGQPNPADPAARRPRH